ncbi:probable ion channel CASTOR isoform 2 [Oryza sativa Japonica Group]|uniref:probable ion channel CASTOR isoform 2 n=1 Tax=Oryza sativa subsp. japonica TaxID=39947 RepID=UPI00077558E2|nr:probable ion channel CASTOR isoform 2 [Oryza sativa Japonica Group]
MPLDPDSSPAPPHRDWFFPPAPPFLPSSRARTPRAPFPSTSRSSNPYSFPDRRPPPTPRSRSRSPLPPPEQQKQQQPPPTTPPPAPRRRDPRYAGVRRGDVRTLTAEKAAAAAAVPTAAQVHGSKSAASATTLRWSGMVSVAAIVLCFSSLVRSNSSLHDQVHHLKAQLAEATTKLQSCITESSMDMSSILSYQSNNSTSQNRDSISEKFDSLRKGRSEVIEQSHTLVLGWSDKLGSLLNQIAIANESLGGGTIVVMAEKDKEEMEADIAKMEFDLKGTAIICRSGSPLILADLKKVSVSKARAIVVLAEEGNADQSDARALRTVLSLTGVKEGLRGHIVVELSDLDNEVLVKLVGGDLVETVVAHDVIGRLMIQCARQPGLAQIWEDILGFENCEFYIKRWPQLDGMQFEDVLISFPDAIPCGIKVASYGGKIILNPDDFYVLQEGDEVLVIAEDDDTYAPAPLPKVMRGYLPKDFVVPKSPERILFCGWRRDMEDMIMVLDAFLAPGSELWMFNDVPEMDRERKLIDGGLDFSRLENITLVHREGNAVIRRHLESLPLESFDSILILADESVEDSAIQADSRSLATLLLIRDIQAKRLPFREAMVSHVTRGSFCEGSWIGEMQQASDKSVIISEILDPRTKNLLSVSKISDYVLSNELVSMALAMVAEDRQINDVLEELFAEQGNEMQIRPADLYLREDEELNFFEVMLRGRQRKEIVIGYRLVDAERAIINPPDKVSRRRWSAKDVFVVITEKE